MQAEFALPAAFAVAALGTFALTPPAIRLARRTGFLDRPMGYKGHPHPTPYLGGLALAGGVTLAAVAFGAAASTYDLLVCALLLAALGTLDDRVNLSPSARVLVEIAVGLALWGSGHGWDILGSGPADALLTVFWVVGIVNAFNLMDNMNGACATCTAVSAFGAAALALDGGQEALAVLCLGMAGACTGFLRFNLARPSRVFMGDGGSMLLGTLVAGVTMSAASSGRAGPTALVTAALTVGLVIFDTALVSVSRRRGRRPLLSGGRDHLTHRLALRLGSSTRVPPALGILQAVLCVGALAVVHASTPSILAVGAAVAVAGVWAGRYLESPACFPAALSFLAPERRPRGPRAGDRRYPSPLVAEHTSAAPERAVASEEDAVRAAGATR